MQEMNTLSHVLAELNKQGYTIDFNRVDENGSVSLLKQNPEQFLIDSVYRFEGDSNPEDEAVLYAISSIDKSILGVFVNGYGISADEDQLALICKIPSRLD
ncbi:phosphoribosylpyrophosphate synthetase [Pedobacter sp. AW1-32]|uniref:phosphoribosylpyrophosphate synthetase n=1 Tax=Pedobacter sp. AW1-32 TaxID=3383026 RepID=UPI003FED637D